MPYISLSLQSFPMRKFAIKVAAACLLSYSLAGSYYISSGHRCHRLHNLEQIYFEFFSNLMGFMVSFFFLFLLYSIQWVLFEKRGFMGVPNREILRWMGCSQLPSVDQLQKLYFHVKIPEIFQMKSTSDFKCCHGLSPFNELSVIM